MTTIAWDGTTLAVDRQTTVGNLKRSKVKLRDCGDFYYAGEGDTADIERIAEWLAMGAHSESRPKVDEGGCHGLAVHKRTAEVFRVMGETIALTKEIDRRNASGSGGQFALAAMELGKSAAEAVVFASTLDAYTNAEVDSVRIPT